MNFSSLLNCGSGAASGILSIAIEQNVVFGIPLAEYLPEQMSRGRIVLVGDAAHVASPMLRAGFVSVWVPIGTTFSRASLKPVIFCTAWRNPRIHWRNAPIWPPSTR